MRKERFYMVHTFYSAAVRGIEGQIVTVEANAIPSSEYHLEIIGLPDTAVKESAARVRAAGRNLGLALKSGRITVNLAPADIRKEGTVYDLPILMSMLRPEELRKEDFSKAIFVGELSLSGTLRPVSGVLPMAFAAANAGFDSFFCPIENAAEASAVPNLKVYPVLDAREILEHFRGTRVIPPMEFCADKLFASSFHGAPDMSEVKGQEVAKKALEIAAAGMHNVMLIGPPGSGKSMLASRLPYILPPMTYEEAVESSKIYSVAGLSSELNPLLTHRPFRSPHHNISSAALAGGGTHIQPGEISLAHNGVLFLDEFPEFAPKAREAMRQPIEDRKVTISRISGTATFPSAFMLIAAMNPCPCGFFGHPTKPCTCSPKSKLAYLSRVSGPVLDRIDIQIEVGALEFDDLQSAVACETSEQIRARVEKARTFALSRFDGERLHSGAPLTANALMEAKHIEKYCVLDDGARTLIRQAFDKLGLSARGYNRLLKVSRTIADFEESEQICKQHVATAVRLRSLDRKYFGNN